MVKRGEETDLLSNVNKGERSKKVMSYKWCKLYVNLLVSIDKSWFKVTGISV